tara:strand:+ start:248 stop:823 length:576 start_codon:yes stop_codon:yes gene_type:complete
MSNSASVMRAQKRKKQKAVDFFGGKCQLCGYNKCISALEFHHEKEKNKKYSPSYVILRWKWEKALKELEKCILVCANCHREIHYGMYKVEDVKRNILTTLTKKCPICQEEFKTKRATQKFCSSKCSSISCRKVDRPSKKELEVQVREMPIVKIGQKYGVLDNTVRKWCKKYNINTKIYGRGYWQKKYAGKI